jgi:orotidine-5'-phosphate decarboxylase
LTIADAKRGDIGNTACQYAASIFDHFGFHAVTVNPYMGRDAILPFSEYKEKGVFVLCLTSNKGSQDLQLKEVDGMPLYHKVIEMVKEINEYDNCGFVVGATHPEELIGVRQNASDMPLLIPGIGAQGGDLESCVKEGNTNGLALINVSRGILYAGKKGAESIHKAAKEYNDRINQILKGEPANV